MPAELETTISELDQGQLVLERSSFWAAGVESDSAPAQSPDSFETLENFLPVTDGVLRKRWGYALFNNPALTARRMYEYQNDTTAARQIVLTATGGVESITEAGAAHNTSIMTPGAGARSPRMVASRSFGYFADGVADDLKKWDGSASGGTTKWGIASPVSATTSTAATSAGTGADYNLGGTIAWTNPGNIVSSNNVYASVTLTPGQLPHYLRATNFGFAVPANATIVGMTVTVEAKTTTFTQETMACYVVKNNKPAGAQQTATIISGGTDQNVAFGSATTLSGFNVTLTPAEVNAADFGAACSFITNNEGNTDFDVDHISIVIAYSQPITVGATSAGSVTLISGRKYAVVFYNSTTRHFSDLSEFSASTGPITTDDIPLSAIPVSTDAQVDRKILLATADGGDETTLYELVDLDNATTTYTDATTEAVLLTRNLYLEVDDFGEERGVAGNQPPPNFDFPTKHRGRLYGAEGQLLYYSKSIDELITSTGLVVGKYEECWPDDYHLDVSEGAETVKGLMSDGEVLYIGTERHIRRLFGDGPLNFSKPDVVFNGVGVAGQDVWQKVFVEGSVAGVMWLTPDLKVMGSDFNTYHDVGGPVQDTLDTINRTHLSKAWATPYSDGSLDLYVLAIPTGAATEPDKLLVYDLRNRRWHVWTPTDKATAGLFNIKADGTPQFVFGADTGKTYKFAAANTQDRVSDTPVSFTATAQTAWLDHGDPGGRKLLQELEVFGASGLLVTIDAASTDAEFTAPANVVTSAALVTSPLGDFKVYLSGKTTKDRFYRYKFVSSADTASPVLRRYASRFVPLLRF